jgi:rRNA maturation protein Nop10
VGLYSEQIGKEENKMASSSSSSFPPSFSPSSPHHVFRRRPSK